jgi:hypothetical protein
MGLRLLDRGVRDRARLRLDHGRRIADLDVDRRQRRGGRVSFFGLLPGARRGRRRCSGRPPSPPLTGAATGPRAHPAGGGGPPASSGTRAGPRTGTRGGGDCRYRSVICAQLCVGGGRGRADLQALPSPWVPLRGRQERPNHDEGGRSDRRVCAVWGLQAVSLRALLM